MIFKPEKETQIGIESDTGFVFSSALQGILVNIFNPLAFVFWLAVMSIIPNEHDFWGVLLVLVTMFFSDCLKAIMIDRYRHQLSPHLFHHLNLLMGILSVLLGLRLMVF